MDIMHTKFSYLQTSVFHPNSMFVISHDTKVETQAAHEDSVTEDLHQVSKPAPPQLEKILDTKIKKTRRRQYTQYLVKWKNRPATEAIWMDEKQISKHGSSVQDLISSGLEIHPTGEYAAVADRKM